MVYRAGLAIILCLIMSSCYTLKNTSISTDLESFYIANFRNNAPNAPAEIGQIFSDRLREKVLRDTRLAYAEVDPSVEFLGTISSYSVSSVAPSTDDGQIGSSLNRLSVTVNVEYIDNTNEDNSYSRSFGFFQDFDATSNLFDVQDALIDEIFNQITEDVFNESFSNW